MADADVEIKASRDQIAALERENDVMKREQLDRDEVSLTFFLYSSNG